MSGTYNPRLQRTSKYLVILIVHGEEVAVGVDVRAHGAGAGERGQLRGVRRVAHGVAVRRGVDPARGTRAARSWG